jgi:hypothetical protein
MAFQQYLPAGTSSPHHKRLNEGLVLFYTTTVQSGLHKGERKAFMTLNPADAKRITHDGSLPYVLLFWNADTSQIGMKAVEEPCGALKVRSNSKYQPWVYVAGLFKCHGISIPSRHSAPISHDEREGMWIVQLPKQTT